MSERKHKVLLVEPDPDLIEILVSGLSRRFDPRLTCVDNASSAIEADLGDPHDLVISELKLEDISGLRLASQLASLVGGERPFLLMANRLTARKAVRALRLGVRDIFTKPFVLSDLLDRAEELLGGYLLHRRHVAKYHRLRSLVRHVIRERRDLNRRTELICKDLVGAHRRLVHRVLEVEDHVARNG